MTDTDTQLREIRSELRHLQRQLTQLLLFTRANMGDMLSLEEAALYTGYAKSYLYKLASSGKLPCYRPTKRRVFVDRAELDKWIKKQN